MFGRFIDDEKMYDWDSAYISQVLHSPVYAGHIIYEAKPTVSMKSKKRRYIPFEERAIVPNTHEAIIHPTRPLGKRAANPLQPFRLFYV